MAGQAAKGNQQGTDNSIRQPRCIGELQECALLQHHEAPRASRHDPQEQRVHEQSRRRNAVLEGLDRKLYLRAAILADELGYDSFWIPEAWGYEVFALLTEIALNTRRIRLGTGIVNVFSRSRGCWR